MFSLSLSLTVTLTRVVQLRASAQADHPATAAVGHGLTTTTTTATHLRLHTTPAYAAYRAAATPTPGALPPVVELIVCVGVGVPASATHPGGVASRRHRRLTTAWEGLDNAHAPPEAEDGGGAADPNSADAPLGLAGFLFDPTERDLEHATFSMQEVMVLAMLHTKQLQAVEERHQQALAEALARPHTPATPPRPSNPPLVAMASAHVQTDAPPPPTHVVEEKVVEKVGPGTAFTIHLQSHRQLRRVVCVDGRVVTTHLQLHSARVV